MSPNAHTCTHTYRTSIKQKHTHGGSVHIHASEQIETFSRIPWSRKGLDFFADYKTNMKRKNGE